MRMCFVAGRWVDESDFEAMGPPETSIEMPGEITFGLLIPCPFGRHTDAMLAIHANWETEEVTASIGTVVERDTDPPAMDMTLLSNPRRVTDADDLA